MDIGRQPVQVSAAQADKRSLPNTRTLAKMFEALSADIDRQVDVGGSDMKKLNSRYRRNQ
jgi:hypothetical protein